jgi:hypothetical protein
MGGSLGVLNGKRRSIEIAGKASHTLIKAVLVGLSRQGGFLLAARRRIGLALPVKNMHPLERI